MQSLNEPGRKSWQTLAALAFRIAHEHASLARRIATLRADLLAASMADPAGSSGSMLEGLDRLLETGVETADKARRWYEGTAPAHGCPVCDGAALELKCATCEGRGWLTGVEAAERMFSVADEALR